jgi:hypothetical protein
MQFDATAECCRERFVQVDLRRRNRFQVGPEPAVGLPEWQGTGTPHCAGASPRAAYPPFAGAFMGQLPTSAT